MVSEAQALKELGPQGDPTGPSELFCWWFYWNGANNNDKGAHAGDDFLPWWLNEVYWQDKVSGKRSVDLFDIHAYPDGPDTSGYTQGPEAGTGVAHLSGLLGSGVYKRIGRHQSAVGHANSTEQNDSFFRIPRITRAIANMIYPNTPLSFTEWNASFAGESDFSTALADAEAYGIMGRERLFLASRWVSSGVDEPERVFGIEAVSQL